MLSSRFIISFFIGTILLAWIIPPGWMDKSGPILHTEPTSPWRSVFSIEDVAWGNASPYIRISVNDLLSPIFISDWSIENENGRRQEIGLGTEFIVPGTIPVPERIRVASDTAVLVSFGPSPLGVSFKEHRCSGYLRGTKPFIPPIEARCPELSSHPGWNTLDDTCKLFVSSLPRCEVVSPEHLADMSTVCGAFLRSVPTYTSCVRETGADALVPSWRIFVPHNEDFIKKTGGTVILKDADGLVVDTLTYQTIGVK